MKIEELPERWRTKLRTYLREQRGVERDQPSKVDFNMRECFLSIPKKKKSLFLPNTAELTSSHR